MDELDVGGKKYISSKRASELTAYAKDYIGQLARAGKVPGTRFGRAWYVDEAALLEYLGKGAAPTSGASFATEETSSISKTISEKPLLTHHMITPAVLPKTWSDIKYIEDHSELFPTLIPHVPDEPALKAVSVSVPSSANEKPIPSVESRVAALVDGIRPKSAVLRVAVKTPVTTPLPDRKPIFDVVIPQKPLPKLHKIDVRWSRGTFSTAFAVFVFMFGATASFVVFKDLSVQGAGTAYAASATYGFEEFVTLIRDARILESGVQALSGFYYLLRDSFGVFVETALQFIGSLL